MDLEIVAYNLASLICALFVLERSADVFIDHTVIVARRTSIPQSAIALLTAGAEWEELIVVAASLARKRSSLAIGNVIGSTIANILGAFSLGLIFYKRQTTRAVFERSSRIYAFALLAVTTVAAALLLLNGVRWRLAGQCFLALFAVYIISISVLIARGITQAPEELSDSESEASESDEEPAPVDRSGVEPGVLASEHTPLLTRRPNASSKPSRAAIYHVAVLILGFIGVVISGYVLSNAASNLVDATGMSDVLAGVILLSIATTIPEKFVAILSGYKGHMDIMLANTVGSNLFLLTLCLGIVWTASDGTYDGGGINQIEICVMFGSALALALTVVLNGAFHRTIGCAMLAAYLGFILLEFTVEY